MTMKYRAHTEKEADRVGELLGDILHIGYSRMEGDGLTITIHGKKARHADDMFGALQRVGNEAGRPFTPYASEKTQIRQLLGTATDVSNIVQDMLGQIEGK